jgi:hypothetical protein
MNHEQGTSSTPERPDKPLVVKCEYNSHRRRLNFESARLCTYDHFKKKVLTLFVIALTLNCCLLDRGPF